MRTVIEAARGPVDETPESWADYARQALAAIAAKETLEDPARIAAAVVSLMPGDPRDYPKSLSNLEEWVATMHREHAQLVMKLAEALAALRMHETDAADRVARAVSDITSGLATLATAKSSRERRPKTAPARRR